MTGLVFLFAEDVPSLTEVALPILQGGQPVFGYAVCSQPCVCSIICLNIGAARHGQFVALVCQQCGPRKIPQRGTLSILWLCITRGGWPLGLSVGEEPTDVS